ncbi:tetratricopeptide repeat protein [Ideonella sp.]|uniref:tetratricopeptide repeat protein n=1 Tax=Ideonella sp. TaxID=1929293 RepID=UPI0035AF9563
MPATPAPAPTRRPAPLRLLAAAAVLAGAGASHAQPAPAPATAPAPAAAASAPAPNSALDAALLETLIEAELKAQGGDLGDAYGDMLAAARRSRDEQLFQRAVEIAVAARSGDRALATVRAWRATLPESVAAVQTQLQLLAALDRPADVAEPLRTLIERQPATDRGATIAAVPRFLGAFADKPRALAAAEQALAPYAGASPTRTAARTALARLALAADQPAKALDHARRALAEDPAAPGPVLVALELMPKEPAAETLVQGYLVQREALTVVRLAYARALDQQQRIGEAAEQLGQVLQAQPEQPGAWLTLGAYLVDLRENDEAIRALERVLSQPTAAADTGADEPADTPGAGTRAPRDPHATADLAVLLMAQAHEQKGDLRAAEAWLDRIPPERVDMSVLVRRASVWAAQGRMDQARALVREGAVRDAPEARTRLLAEAQVLRDRRQWGPAHELLLGALRQQPDDTTLMYELAMVAERLARFDDMEALLRRVITLKPDDHHAHNALGYSLADRGLRLSEALSLVQQAARLAPHDPFILDSLGWVQFRLGRPEEAVALLRRAHRARPHVEVAAHLGEVLWTLGRRDEALQVWRDGRRREADNEVLRETLQRLQVAL